MNFCEVCFYFFKQTRSVVVSGIGRLTRSGYQRRFVGTSEKRTCQDREQPGLRGYSGFGRCWQVQSRQRPLTGGLAEDKKSESLPGGASRGSRLAAVQGRRLQPFDQAAQGEEYQPDHG